MFISVYASGTNVQRLAKCAKNIDGVLYTAYAQLEKEEAGIIRRKFYCTEVDSLRAQVESLDENSQYYQYLDMLRESGITNMFGAGKFLEYEFGVNRYEARNIVLAWMKQFSK